MHACQHDGRIAPVVARGRVLLLVAAVVLLVDNDQAQLAERQKHGRAHPDHHQWLIGGEQPPPDVNALIVAELGVIDEQLVAEDSPQPARQLGGERNLGHQIEHLVSHGQHVGYQVHINSRLPARSDPVKQCDGMLAHAVMNLGVGAALVGAELGRGVGVRAHFSKPVDGTLVNLKHALGHRGLQHRGAHRGTLEQVVLGDLLQLGALHPSRQVQIGQQQRFLLGGALHLVEKRVQRRLVVARDGESHTRFRLGPVVVHHALAHADGVHVEHLAHQPFHILEARGPCDVGDLHPAALCGKVEHHALAVGERARLRFLEIGVHTDERLAFHLQSRRKRRLVDLAHGAQVVVGNPVPEFELRMAQDGLVVEPGHDFFHLVALGLDVVKHGDDAGVNLLASEGHEHTMSHPDGLARCDAVGVGARNGQWQQDFGKVWHRADDGGLQSEQEIFETVPFPHGKNRHGRRLWGVVDEAERVHARGQIDQGGS